MSSVDGELCHRRRAAAAAAASAIIRGCRLFFTRSASSLSLPALPPSCSSPSLSLFLSVHLLKFPLFRDLFSSSSLLLPVPSQPPHSPIPPSSSSPPTSPRLSLRGPGYGLNMTAIPLKRGGIIILIIIIVTRAHQRQAAAPRTNLTGAGRERRSRAVPPFPPSYLPPPNPRAPNVSIWKVRTAGGAVVVGRRSGSGRGGGVTATAEPPASAGAI